MFLRSCVCSILSNRFIARCSLKSSLILSASQDVYVSFLRLLLPYANARSPRDCRSTILPAPSCRGTPAAACIADDPTTLLKKTQTLPTSHCPTLRATNELRHLSTPSLPARRLTARNHRSRPHQSRVRRRLFRQRLRNGRKEARSATRFVKARWPAIVKRRGPVPTTKSRAYDSESLPFAKLRSTLQRRRRSARASVSSRRHRQTVDRRPRDACRWSTAAGRALL